MQICKNPNIYCEIYSLSKSMQFFLRNMTMYAYFKNALDPVNFILQKYMQNCQNLNMYVKALKAAVQKSWQNFFADIVNLFGIGFPKSSEIQ